MMVDQVIFSPADEEIEKYDINIKSATGGSPISSVSTAQEGETVTIDPNPVEGYSLKAWNIIHGKIDLKENEDGTFSFVMPEDIVTLEPIYEDNTVAYKMDLTNVLEGTFAPGWRAEMNESSVQQYPNSYGSGSRTFVGFTGTYYKGTYWRGLTINYGKQDNYKLHLVPGNYRLTYVMAAWKGTPQYKAQILTSKGNALKETQYFTATPNANGSKSSNLSSAEQKTMEFEVKQEGDYIINFYTNGGDWAEFLLLSCSLNKIPESTDIETAVIGSDIESGEYEIFDEAGRRLPALRKGINIIRKNGVEVKKLFIR